MGFEGVQRVNGLVGWCAGWQKALLPMLLKQVEGKVRWIEEEDLRKKAGAVM